MLVMAQYMFLGGGGMDDLKKKRKHERKKIVGESRVDKKK